MLDMAKPKKKPDSSPKPSPEKKKRYKNVSLPIPLHQEAEKVAESIDRSVAWLVRKAIKDLLKQMQNGSSP